MQTRSAQQVKRVYASETSVQGHVNIQRIGGIRLQIPTFLPVVPAQGQPPTLWPLFRGRCTCVPWRDTAERLRRLASMNRHSSISSSVFTNDARWSPSAGVRGIWDASSPWVRSWARVSLAWVPRGGAVRWAVKRRQRSATGTHQDCSRYALAVFS